MKPYPDVVDMIECVNSVVESEALDPNVLSDSHIFDKCVVLSEKVVSDRKPYNISTLCQDKWHRDIVLTKIIKTFLKIKIGHMCQMKKETMKSQIMHIYKIMPIFKHECVM